MVSVGPLLTWPACHAAIWVRHRRIVRPSWRTSGGELVSRMSAES
jgi:hypothetical protein